MADGTTQSLILWPSNETTQESNPLVGMTQSLIPELERRKVQLKVERGGMLRTL